MNKNEISPEYLRLTEETNALDYLEKIYFFLSQQIQILWPGNGLLLLFMVLCIVLLYVLLKDHLLMA